MLVMLRTDFVLIYAACSAEWESFRFEDNAVEGEFHFLSI